MTLLERIKKSANKRQAREEIEIFLRKHNIGGHYDTIEPAEDYEDYDLEIYITEKDSTTKIVQVKGGQIVNIICERY